MKLVELLNHQFVEVSHEDLGVFEHFYFGFNAFEAAAWFAFAAIVLFRWFRHRKTWLEVLCSLLFLRFGISDVIEIIFHLLW